MQMHATDISLQCAAIKQQDNCKDMHSYNTKKWDHIYINLHLLSNRWSYAMNVTL